MHSSIHIYDNIALSVINTDFKLQTLADDCLFTEGPVWNKQGFYLFSDIDANAVYKIEEGKAKEIFISHSGTSDPSAEGIRPDHAGSNALTYDGDGNLLICQHGNHAIAKWQAEALQPFITLYKQRPFNSPNDIVVSKNGTIYFSDPPYGLTSATLNPEKFQPIAAVYSWKNGEAKIICDKYQYPNGVCLTPGEEELYICSNKRFEDFISVYDVATLQFKKILAKENSDGIKCDPGGNVYLCNNDGVIVLNSNGKRIALIQLPTIPANICWGGKNLNDLFITARENIFLIKDLLK